MTVAHILQTKGPEVVTARPDVAILEISQMLAEKKIGAVLVTTKDGSVAGIISERDIVRALSQHGTKLDHAKVRDFMTSELITCTPEATVDQIMSLMSEGRVRHLPVLKDGKLCGLISIGDVVKRRIAQVEFEAEEMKRYIAG